MSSSDDSIDMESFENDSESSFSSIDSLRDSLAYVSTLIDVPKSLETNYPIYQYNQNKITNLDPLSYVTTNIPRMNKPALVDMIIHEFVNAVFLTGSNPSHYFSNKNYENEVMSLLSQHSKIKNLQEIQKALHQSHINDDIQSGAKLTYELEYKEFFIVCTHVNNSDALMPDTPLALGLWRFHDILRIGTNSQHFTKFFVFCVVNDEPAIDIAHMLAVLFSIPQVYSALWNQHKPENIISIVEESENIFLNDLAQAHEAIDRVNDQMMSIHPNVEMKNNDWLQRRMMITHELSYHHKHQIEDEEISCRMIFCCKGFGSGVVNDVKRRIPFYISDWVDGFSLKPIWVSIFLTLGILPYVFIFGTSIDDYTGGYMNTWHILISCIVAGIVMSIFSPQPMIFLSPSAAFILFLKTAKTISSFFGFTLSQIYPLTAIFASIFLIFFAFTNISASVKYVTIFSDEIFVAFVAILFIGDSIEGVLHAESQLIQVAASFVALTVFVLTFAINKLKYNTLTFSFIRSLASDSAPVFSSLFVFLLCYFLFPDVYEVLPKYSLYDLKGHASFISFTSFNAKLFFLCLILGFCASVLTLLEHNITSKLVNNEEMNLRKPCAYHLDILILGILNLFLGMFSMPLVVASKIHTFHHIHAMSVHSFEYDEE